MERATILLFSVLVSMFVLNIDRVDALSCVPTVGGEVAVAAFREGKYIDGFTVEETYIDSDRSCATRSVVIDGDDGVKNFFILAAQHLNLQFTTGVYQSKGYSSYCAATWSEWCVQGLEIERVSVDPTDLSRYRDEWKSVETGLLRATPVKKWAVTIFISIVTLIAVMLPWILLWRRKIRRVWLLFSAAIIVQLIIAFFLPSLPCIIFCPDISYYTSPIFSYVVLVSFLVFLSSVILEAGYLISRAIRFRKSSTK